MAIRVIFKDKNIGIVNESRLNDLISLERVAAFCRPNGEWVGVGLDSARPGSCYHEKDEEPSIHAAAVPEPSDKQGVSGMQLI